LNSAKTVLTKKKDLVDFNTLINRNFTLGAKIFNKNHIVGEHFFNSHIPVNELIENKLYHNRKKPKRPMSSMPYKKY